MGGGLMQLVAYGAQDVYLTGNPQITFFKVVYRRHTNFAVEAIEQTFNGTPTLGGKATVPITRNGDLVTKMYLKTTITHSNPSGVDLSNTTGLVDKVGFALIKSVELQIGGTKIDKHYGRWLHIWDELTRSSTHDESYEQIIEGVDDDVDEDKPVSTHLYVPLAFFCCRNNGLALPLIALQYHDVRLEFEFSNAKDLVMITEGTNNLDTVSISNTTLLVDYIYLDSEERKRFAQASHEYLIEQLQFTGVESVTPGQNNKIRLNFNHPVKEIVWGVSGADLLKGDGSDSNGNEKFTSFAGIDGKNPVETALLQLNGHDRFSEETGKYFNYVQTLQHHTRTPTAGVNVYSFALKPEEHQPSGTCNFSRIDNATLNVKLSGTSSTVGNDLYVYAVNYNVLRIMSGMGGVAYSN